MANTCALPAAVEGDCWQIGDTPNTPQEYRPVPLTLLKSAVILICTLFQMWVLNEAHPKHKVLSKLFVLASGKASTLMN
jgi:hypothetical protein